MYPVMGNLLRKNYWYLWRLSVLFHTFTAFETLRLGNVSLTCQLTHERLQHQCNPHCFFPVYTVCTLCTQAPSANVAVCCLVCLTGRPVPLPHQLLFVSPQSNLQDTKIAQRQQHRSLNGCASAQMCHDTIRNVFC